MAKDLNYANIQIESDCLLAIQELKRVRNSLSEWRSLSLDIMDLSSEFNLCSFDFISRSANMTTHNVAKVQCELGSCQIWRNCLPPNLYNPDSIST